MSQKAIVENKGEYHLNAKLKEDEVKEEPHIPDEFFRTTDEMLDEFSFLDEKTRKEIVIENPNKVADLVEYNIEVIIATDKPFSPIIEDSEKQQEIWFTIRLIAYMVIHFLKILKKN